MYCYTSIFNLSTSQSIRGLTSSSEWEFSSWSRFHAQMPSAFIRSVLSYPTMLLAKQLVHHRYVHPGPLVLGTALLKIPTPTTDRDQTVSRRFEPSSRTALMGGQPNPWNRIQLQDAMSRHRGAKPPRRCELLGEISLLSPGQLLSVERWHFHSHTTGSLTPTFVTARPVGLAVRLAFAFALSVLVSVQDEPTFERLRYSLGGDRPSQTAHLTMSPDSIQSRRLEFQYRKDGIPTASPPAPKHWFPRVPSILCMQHRNPILGYSKAPWGLSVLSRVTGIFTGTTISPGGLLRQCPNHYAFRAGQNLPDKEFRYLRTVIVTAAVHWGFGSKLRLASNKSP